MIVGARNKLRSTFLIFLLTSLKPNSQSVCGFGCTQIGNLLLKLGVLFGSMEKLTLERNTCFVRRG
jgi:hypothetical protein